MRFAYEFCKQASGFETCTNIAGQLTIDFGYEVSSCLKYQPTCIRERELCLGRCNGDGASKLTQDFVTLFVKQELAVDVLGTEEIDRGRADCSTRSRIVEIPLFDTGGRSAASCRSDPQPTSMSAYMSNLNVMVEYRKKTMRVGGRRCAIAIELMRECEAVALEWGYGATYLNVYEKNEGSVRLYTSKLGYEVISEPSTQLRARGGPGPVGPLPAFRMRKTLVGAPLDGVVVPTKLPLSGQQQPPSPASDAPRGLKDEAYT